MSFAHLAVLVLLGLTKPLMTARLKVVKQHSQVGTHKTAEAPTQEQIDEAKSATSEGDKAMEKIVSDWELFQIGIKEPLKDGKMTKEIVDAYTSGLSGFGSESVQKFYELLFKPEAPEGLGFVEFAKRWIALHKGDAIWTIWDTPARYNWFNYLEHDIPEDAPSMPSASSADNPRYWKFATTTLNADSPKEETRPAARACSDAWSSFVCDAETDLPKSTASPADCLGCGDIWCGRFKGRMLERSTKNCEAAELNKNYPWHTLIPEP